MGNESVKFRICHIGMDTPSLFGEGRGGGVMACVKLAPYFAGKILPLEPS